MELPGLRALGVITWTSGRAGSRDRTDNTACPGAERALCPQADSPARFVCLPAEIWAGGGWRPIGPNEAVVSFLALKTTRAPRGSPLAGSSWGVCPVTDLPTVTVAEGSAARGRRARRGRGAPLREEILTTAERLLGERRDLDAISMRALADAVGVT